MSTIRVAICDDQVFQASFIETVLMKSNAPVTIECDVYHNPLRFQKELRKQMYDLYFLDIEMPEVNGLQLAQTIRQHDLHGFIIFCTNYAQYMPEVFAVNTFDYLMKPLTEEKIYQTVYRALQLLEIDEHVFSYQSKGQTVKISLKEIIYFEKAGRYCYLHRAQSTERFIMRTKELLENLDDSFVQIHTSFVINIRYLEKMDGNNAICKKSLAQESELLTLPISRKYKKETKEKILAYLERIYE